MKKIILNSYKLSIIRGNIAYRVDYDSFKGKSDVSKSFKDSTQILSTRNLIGVMNAFNCDPTGLPYMMAFIDSLWEQDMSRMQLEQHRRIQDLTNNFNLVRGRVG